MRRDKRIRLGLLALLAGCCFIAGCGGGAGASKSATAFLHVQTTASDTQGPVQVEHISYTTFDGTTVPALFAIPRAFSPRGCLIWENGFGSTKEATARSWPGAARLGLAVFAIDLRDHGERAAFPGQRFRAARNPTLLNGLITGTVKDLELAADYLWAQPACHHNIGYVGLSLGAIIGSIFVGQDQRVRAAVLMSVPPTILAVRSTSAELLPGIGKHPAQLSLARRLLTPLDPDLWIGKISPRPVLLMFGSHDPLVPPRYARASVASARAPVTVVHYNGGHIPFAGPAARANAKRIGLFLLQHLTEPTYGVSGSG